MKEKTGHTIKTCSICGKREGSHWARHWREKHPDQKPKELRKPPEGLQIRHFKQVDLCKWNKEKVQEYWWEDATIYDPNHR